MLSVLEVITVSKLPYLSLPYGLGFVSLKCLLQYLRRYLHFYIFIEPLNVLESNFIRGDNINLFTSAILFTIGKNTQHTYRYLHVLLCASAAWLSKYLAEKKSLGHNLSVNLFCSFLCVCVFFYVFNRALWYTYVIRTNKIHTFFINYLIQLHCLRHVSNNQVFILRKIFTRSFIVFISCIHISSLVDQTAYMDEWKKCHETACTNLPEDEHLVVGSMSRQCNWIKSLMKKVCILFFFITRTYAHLFLCCVSWVRVRVTSDSCEAQTVP